MEVFLISELTDGPDNDGDYQNYKENSNAHTGLENVTDQFATCNENEHEKQW